MSLKNMFHVVDIRFFFGCINFLYNLSQLYRTLTYVKIYVIYFCKGISFLFKWIVSLVIDRSRINLELGRLWYCWICVLIRARGSCTCGTIASYHNARSNILEVVDPAMLQDDRSVTNIMKIFIIPLVRIGLLLHDIAQRASGYGTGLYRDP
jgi:hypothetical protein